MLPAVSQSVPQQPASCAEFVIHGIDFLFRDKITADKQQILKKGETNAYF